jgi:hypothetical protein
MISKTRTHQVKFKLFIINRKQRKDLVLGGAGGGAIEKDYKIGKWSEGETRK